MLEEIGLAHPGEAERKQQSKADVKIRYLEQENADLLADLEDLEETMRINKGIIKNLVEASNLPTASTRMIDSLEKESDALRA